MTRQEEVLAVLIRADGAWVDGSQLATAEVGGSEGLKRLREARAQGWAIEERRHPSPGRAVWQYRLDPTKPRPARPVPPPAPRTGVVEQATFERKAEPVAQRPPTSRYRCSHCGGSVEATDTGFGYALGTCTASKECRALKVQSFRVPK